MDRVFEAFCLAAQREADTLTAQSDVLTVLTLPPQPSSRFLVQLRVPHFLRRKPDRTIELAPGPVEAGIRFPADYLMHSRQQDNHWSAPHLQAGVVTILTPQFVHPNVREGVVCLGAQFNPGTPLRVLIRQLYDLVTYNLMTLDERNAMDGEVCRAIRANPHWLSSLSAPPLTRRTHRVTLNEAGTR
jgi:hypothetical protein